MKRLLAFCFLLAWACRCAAQAPTVYVDNLTGTNIIVTGTGCTNTILSCSIATSNGTLYSTWSPGMVFLFGDPQSINLDTTGLVLGPQAIFKTFLYQGTIRLSPADGAFHITPDVHFDNVVYGDGSGLTNIMGTNIVGTLNTSNLPPWVAYTSSNQTFTASNNFSSGFGIGTNVSLVPNVSTSAIVLQAGSAVTLQVTNGHVAVGGGTTPEVFQVTGSSSPSFLIRDTGANTVFRFTAASGNTYLQTGTAYTSGSKGAMHFTSMFNADDWLTIGATGNIGMGTTSPSNKLVVIGNETISGSFTATNGIYYSATSNGVVSTNVIQPLHTFAALMGFVTNTINGGANTYAIVTNYSTARTNLMSCSLTAGTITNTIAGYYYCAIHMSMVALDAGALVEGDLLLNGVVRDEVSFQTQFDPGTPRYKGASAFGILYIPANSQITFQIKSSGASGIELRRQQLVVMPP